MASDAWQFSTGLSTESVEKITTPSWNRHFTVTFISYEDAVKKIRYTQPRFNQ